MRKVVVFKTSDYVDSYDYSSIPIDEVNTMEVDEETYLLLHCYLGRLYDNGKYFKMIEYAEPKGPYNFLDECKKLKALDAEQEEKRKKQAETRKKEATKNALEKKRKQLEKLKKELGEE